MNENMTNYNGMNSNLYNNQNLNNIVSENKKRDKWIVLITVLIALISVFGKIMTMGWATFIGVLSMIMPLHWLLFIIAGIKFSKKKEINKSDYILFLILCITNLLYIFLFVDGGDVGGPSTFFPDLNQKVLDIFSPISMICFLISFVISIIIISRCKIKKQTNRNQNFYRQQNLNQQSNQQVNSSNNLNPNNQNYMNNSNYQNYQNNSNNIR